MKPHPVPVERLIRDCRILLETEANHHRVQLKLVVARGLPNVRVDAVLIQQVVFNLARNGIEAINDSDSAQRQLSVQAFQENDDEIVIAVSDTGKGVSEDLREKLFDPFVSTRKQGLGIGLSLCRSVVDSHRGRVWLAQTPGPGATFCFSLPVDQGADRDA